MPIRFVALVIVVAACLRATPAHARYICDADSLLPSDQRRLENAAGDLLGPRGIERGTEWFCRGPAASSARFETRHVGSAGGSTRWAEVNCVRRRGAWTCNATERRALKVEVRVGADSFRVRAEIPVDMDAATARTIVAKAFELAQSSAPTPPCNGPDQATVIRDRLIRDFSADDDRIKLEGFNAELVVSTSNLVLMLRETSAHEVASYELRCWTEPIIVTA